MPKAPTLNAPHAIEYTKLPTQWAEGLPLGNGELGVLCWSDGRQLRFTFDCAGAWDLRHRKGAPDCSALRYEKVREWVAAGDFESLDAAARSTGEPHRLCPTKVYLGRLDLTVDFAPDSELSLSLNDACVRGAT